VNRRAFLGFLACAPAAVVAKPVKVMDLTCSTVDIISKAGVQAHLLRLFAPGMILCDVKMRRERILRVTIPWISYACRTDYDPLACVFKARVLLEVEKI
jgi:hypothetical protein